MSYETTQRVKGITTTLSRTITRATPTWEQISRSDEKTAQRIAWDFFGEVEELFSHVDDALILGQLDPAKRDDLVIELLRKRRDWLEHVERRWETLQQQGYIDLDKYEY